MCATLDRMTVLRNGKNYPWMDSIMKHTLFGSGQTKNYLWMDSIMKLGENKDKKTRHVSLRLKSFNQIAFF